MAKVQKLHPEVQRNSFSKLPHPASPPGVYTPRGVRNNKQANPKEDRKPPPANPETRNAKRSSCASHPKGAGCTSFSSRPTQKQLGAHTPYTLSQTKIGPAKGSPRQQHGEEKDRGATRGGTWPSTLVETEQDMVRKQVEGLGITLHGDPRPSPPTHAPFLPPRSMCARRAQKNSGSAHPDGPTSHPPIAHRAVTKHTCTRTHSQAATITARQNRTPQLAHVGGSRPRAPPEGRGPENTEGHTSENPPEPNRREPSQAKHHTLVKGRRSREPSQAETPRM